MLLYFLCIIDNEALIKAWPTKIIIATYFIETVLILLTPTFHTIFYYDNNLVYQHGDYYIVCAILLLLILIAIIVILARHNTDITLLQLLTVPTVIIISLLANIIQILIPSFSFTSVTLAISTILLTFTIQNPIGYYDETTNIFSRKSLRNYSYYIESKKIKYQVIVIDIASTDLLNKTIGYETMTALIKKVSATLKPLSGNRKYLFLHKGDTFIFITTKNKYQNDLLKKINEIFPLKYDVGESSYMINARIMYTDCSLSIPYESNTYDLLTDGFNECKRSNKNIFDSEILEKVIRKKEVEVALNNAIKDKKFEVYLQPIYNTETKTYDRAESLVRIKDKRLGLIMPYEFISVAEQNGTITQLTPIVIENVCKYLSSVNLPDTFKHVSINLSVLDCLRDHLDKEILHTINSYNLDPKRFIFEITETVAVTAPKVKKLMIKLRSSGIKFALDDFGSGYANIKMITKLPFNIIKIDRQLVLLIDNPKYEIVLQGITSIFKDYKYTVIAEGIETQHMADKLSSIEAKIHQGYLYSKPLCMEDFTKFIYQHAEKVSV
ncbi:MAG: EAL domain-containing protein [Sphaerochaeta sp.]